MTSLWLPISRWGLLVAVSGFTCLCLGCGTTYKGTAGDLSIDGRPVANNLVELDDLRIAVVYRPLYTHKESKNFGFSGPDEALEPAVQQIAFIFEAKTKAVDVGFGNLQLRAACQEGVRPRGVSNIRDAKEMRQRVAEVPKHRRGAHDFDPLIELKEREDYPSLSLMPPAEHEIALDMGMSCLAGEMVMFELVYALPSCYDVAEPMTLVLSGIRVGNVEIGAIEIAVAKREYEYTRED